MIKKCYKTAFNMLKNMIILNFKTEVERRLYFQLISINYKSLKFQEYSINIQINFSWSHGSLWLLKGPGMYFSFFFFFFISNHNQKHILFWYSFFLYLLNFIYPISYICLLYWKVFSKPDAILRDKMKITYVCSWRIWEL